MVVLLSFDIENRRGNILCHGSGADECSSSDNEYSSGDDENSINDDTVPTTGDELTTNKSNYSSGVQITSDKLTSTNESTNVSSGGQTTSDKLTANESTNVSSGEQTTGDKLTTTNESNKSCSGQSSSSNDVIIINDVTSRNRNLLTTEQPVTNQDYEHYYGTMYIYLLLFLCAFIM